MKRLEKRVEPDQTGSSGPVKALRILKLMGHYRSILSLVDLVECEEAEVTVCVCVSHSVVSNSLRPHGL